MGGSPWCYPCLYVAKGDGWVCGSPNLICARMEYLLYSIKPVNAELLVGSCLGTVHTLENRY